MAVPKHAKKSHSLAGTSLTGIFAGSFNPVAYTAALQERIKEFWKIAPALGTKSGVVAFTVDHSGNISDLQIKEHSGSKDYDQSMLKAIQTAVPMPPLVASAPAKMVVEFTFNERLLKGQPSKEDLKKIVAEQGAVLERDPADYQALTKRGRAHLRLGDYGRAIEDYKVVISNTEENVQAYIERAKCYLYIDDYKNALKDCLECQKTAPTLARPYTLAAVAQLGLGHLEEAQSSIDQGINLSPNDPESWALRADCDNLALKHQAAIADGNKALELDPDCGSAYAYRGDAYEALKDYDAALRDYTKNVELNQGEGQAFLRRAELYSTLGQYDKAVFDATEAIKLSPTSAEAYYYRCHANEELGLKAQAQKDFAKAKQLGLEKIN